MSLTKRWHEEITTLHFPIGKMTIIIDDVSCLLHLPTHGILMNHQTWVSTKEGASFPNELFGVHIVDAFGGCEKLEGAHIWFSWLLEVFKDHRTKAL